MALHRRVSRFQAADARLLGAGAYCIMTTLAEELARVLGISPEDCPTDQGIVGSVHALLAERDAPGEEISTALEQLLISQADG